MNRCLQLFVLLSASILLVSCGRSRRPVLVCIGDSLTSCGGPGGHYCDALAERMPDVRVIDAGIGGDTLDGGRRRFEKDVLAHRPDAVLIALGANDFWRARRTVGEMRDDLEWMVASAQRAGARVVVAGCFGDRDFWNEVCTEFQPFRFPLAAEIAGMERDVCSKHGCLYIPNMQVDVKPNRLPPYWDETDHPNKEGNVQVALRLMPFLRNALETKTRTK